MIDPLLDPRASRSLPVAARAQRRKRAVPARSAKVLTAGASATALFTMIAAMGWQSGTGSANSPDPTVPVEQTTPTLAVLVPIAAPQPTLAQATPVEPQAASVPAAAVPVITIPVPAATAAPVVVPRAVAVVSPPAQRIVKHKSHITTKSSG